MGARVQGWLWLCVLALAAGCKTEPERDEGAGQATGHEHPIPGIDCPLRKGGVDPSQLRPFAEVEKYIAFLDRLEREAWQKPDEVVRALNLRGSETVYDLGAGSGYFSFRFARAVPRGKVVAADLEPEMIRHIHHKAVAEGVMNLSPVLIKRDEPQVRGEADLVFVCDVLHHVRERDRWMKKVAEEMKPGTRLVLIEFKEGKLPEGPPESAMIPRKQLIELVTRAGLHFEAEKPELLPYQLFLVFRKGAATDAVLETARGETGVIAYYFHGTVRCETCLRIEKQAQDLIGSRSASQVVFRSVNYDEPEHAHFSKDYKLPCPSLVLVRQKNGKEQDWRLLGQTWVHVQIPPKLDQYIEEETTKFLTQ